MNDLPDAVIEGEVKIYADDTTAYCIGDNFDTVTQRLNLIFKQIYMWSQRNRLSIHNGKSELAPFKNSDMRKTVLIL